MEGLIFGILRYSFLNLNVVPLIPNQYLANPRRSFHFKALSLDSLVDCFSYIKLITRPYWRSSVTFRASKLLLNTKSHLQFITNSYFSHTQLRVTNKRETDLKIMG